MSSHYLVKCTTFFIWLLLHSSKRWWLWNKPVVGWQWWFRKRTFCAVWQMECQASNVTANVQSDHLLHRYMLPVFFATDQLHRPPHSAEIQLMLQQDASATRPYRGLMVLDAREKLKKMKSLCILQGSAVTFFRCGGWGSNSLFSSAITQIIRST